jgi:hypothetical protein
MKGSRLRQSVEGPQTLCLKTGPDHGASIRAASNLAVSTKQPGVSPPVFHR